EDGSFFSFNAKYAREPEMLNIEMKDFLENEDTSDFSHTRMNIYFRELGNESPLLVKLIMQSIYKNNDRKVRHLGSKRFGIQFLIKGIYTYNGMLYVHTQTKNSSNVPFDTDFIKFKITDKKVPKRTAIQETVLDAVRSYNEVIEIAGKSTVRTVYALPKFTIPDDKLLVVELYEKNGGRHKRHIFIMMLFALCLTSFQAHAQRYLPGMKGLQVTAGMADGVHWNSDTDFAYHIGAAYSVYTKNANRWV
ncbi:conjugative transposon protein TraN, partial [Bacteroides clarus]|uniref:conjugative transposon protein TraN n=1 Tax=Bacteroides clarus TaxID=626929 RepID=UPI0022E8B245